MAGRVIVITLKKKESYAEEETSNEIDACVQVMHS